MTTTEPTTEEALWLYIGAMPEDGHRRLYAADWFQDRAAKVECKRCGGRGVESVYERGEYGPNRYQQDCPTCQGTGYVPDRNGRLAAALRATADRVPHHTADLWWFHCRDDGYKHWPDSCRLPAELYDASGGFLAAKMAIRTLCAAWAVVHYVEVQE